MKFQNDERFFEEKVLPNGAVVCTRALACKRNEAGEWIDKSQGFGVTIGKGTEIGAGVVIHKGSWRDTSIGRGCRLMGSSVGHNCRIGDNVLIAPMAALGGSCEVGDFAEIWIGASVAQHIKIGAGAVVGMGSVVLKDVPAGAVVYGNPARVRRMGVIAPGG